MIAFERFGKGEHKVIGIHGWFGDETTFVPLQQSLAADKFECAWLAHRGYGKSQGVPGRYTMDEMAEDAMAVANQLGWNRFSVIGHSMGGKAAQLVVARAGDRVRKLVCVTPVTAAPVPFDEQSRALFEGASTDTRRSLVFRLAVGSARRGLASSSRTRSHDPTPTRSRPISAHGLTTTFARCWVRSI
jgi:esterase